MSVLIVGLLQAGKTMCFLCTVCVYGQFFYDPQGLKRRSEAHPVSMRICHLASMAGSGIAIFYLTRFSLSWMPLDWAVGDRWVAEVIAFLVAAYGSFLLPFGMDSVVKRLAELERRVPN